MRLLSHRPKTLLIDFSFSFTDKELKVTSHTVHDFTPLSAVNVASVPVVRKIYYTAH